MDQATLEVNEVVKLLVAMVTMLPLATKKSGLTLLFAGARRTVWREQTCKIIGYYGFTILP